MNLNFPRLKRYSFTIFVYKPAHTVDLIDFSEGAYTESFSTVKDNEVDAWNDLIYHYNSKPFQVKYFSVEDI